MQQLAAIARECKLLARVPLLANLGGEHVEVIGEELVAQLDGLVLVTTGAERPAIRWDRPVIAVELGQPTSAQRATLWRAALGAGSEGDAELLAERYPLAPALMSRAAGGREGARDGRAIAPEDIYAGIRAVLDDRLGQFATPRHGDADLGRPRAADEQLAAIVELIARVRERRTRVRAVGLRREGRQGARRRRRCSRARPAPARRWSRR